MVDLPTGAWTTVNGSSYDNPLGGTPSRFCRPSVLQLIQVTRPHMIDLDLTPIVKRAYVLSNEGRHDDADALFAEFSEWFVEGSDADQGVLLCPSL